MAWYDGLQQGGATRQDSDFLRTPGPGKVQLPDGRYVTESSTLGQAYLQKLATEKSNAEFKQTLGDLMQRADPFAGQRQQYQASLSDLMKNPASATENNPFFKASANVGQEAASRRLAQLGMGTSGNAALELQKSAQANMSGDFFRMADLLGGFSGANQNPAAASNVGMSALNLRENQRQFDYGNTGQSLIAGQSKRGPSGMNLGAYWGV